MRGRAAVLWAPASLLSLALLLEDSRAQSFPPLVSTVDPTVSEAGASEADSLPVQSKRISATRLASAAPEVDGRLDEPAWQSASWISDFLQKEPDQGAPPTERTAVAFLYDADALYVAARMESKDPSAIGRTLTKRDDDGNAERVILSLDTYHDRRTAYSFGVTASGVRLDWFHPEDDETRKDNTFNPVWQARTSIGAGEWTAELRIPFSQLRFSGSDEQVWGVNVQRIIPARNETVYWVYVPRDQTGWSSRFGELVGIASIPPSRRLEVMPYVAGDTRITSRDLIDPDNPLEERTEVGARTGADVKMGLGSNLTLDATINPDFGQVEADPAQVNLSAFEIFFDERRPFFTEGGQLLGAHLYAEPQPNDPPSYFYSRRIGGPPHGRAQGDFVDPPAATSILGAAKVTGRMASGLSIGALTALTGEERARAFHLAERATDDVEVEPLTAFGVTRLQQQFGAAGSTAAVMLTGVRRNLSDDSPMKALLAREAYTGGADWNLRFKRGEYDLKGHVGFSHVAGDEAAIERIQRSSAHYFQRPDQDHVELDPTRTSVTGFTGMMRFRKVSGGHLRGDAGIWGDSPGLELNDAGRLGRADDLVLWGNLRFREDQPGTFFRNYQIGLHGLSENNWGGVRRFTRGYVHSRATWTNFWEGILEVGHVPPWTNDVATRGGPLMQFWSAWDLYAELRNNRQAKTRWEADLFYYNHGSGFNTSGYYLNGMLATEPGDRWRVSVEPHYSHRNEPRQFLANLDDGPEATFGRRYVFSYVERSELSAQFRVSYALTPDLGIDLYAEPFASSGRFYDFGELREPRARDLSVYGRDGTTLQRGPDGEVMVTDGGVSFTLPNPDFNVRSFRSNLLLRWEWQPGSTVYLVWQQNRAGEDHEGRRVGLGSLTDSLGESGENVLALKITYWVPVG